MANFLPASGDVSHCQWPVASSRSEDVSGSRKTDVKILN